MSVVVALAMVGAVVIGAAEVLDWQIALTVVGAILFVGGIVAASAGVALHARRTGTSFLSAAWQGVRAAGALLWDLGP